MANRTKWYSLTAVFLWKEDHGKLPRYEKRVTICSARNEADAKTVLLAEARTYATGNIKFLNLFQIEEVDPPSRRHPVEVAHELMLAVDLTSGLPIQTKEFRRMQWENDRLDDCEKRGCHHSWYNAGGGRSGCCNCRVKRKGRLW